MGFSKPDFFHWVLPSSDYIYSTPDFERFSFLNRMNHWRMGFALFLSLR
jgi:hypothetical protein